MDDIVAVLVIAFFYTANVTWMGLGVAGIAILLLLLANRMGVRHPLPYVVLGIVLWLAVLHSGPVKPFKNLTKAVSVGS